MKDNDSFYVLEQRKENTFTFVKYPFLKDMEIYKQMGILIGCRTVEFTELGNGIDIVSDEEALITSGDKILTEIFIPDMNEPLRIIGKYILVGLDNKGSTIPISNEQFEWFKKLKVKVKMVEVE